MRTAYLNTLYDLASKDKRVYALISDNGAIVYELSTFLGPPRY